MDIKSVNRIFDASVIIDCIQTEYTPPPNYGQFNHPEFKGV